MKPETRDEPISPASIPFDHQPGAPPIIERPDLPAMVAVGDVSLTRAAAKKKMTMRDAPAADTGGPGRMDPVPDPAEDTPFLDVGVGQLLGQAVPGGRAAFPDQQQPQGAAEEKPAEEGYVRLRMRYYRGALTILSAHAVEGPLVQSATVGSGHVYEVISGKARLALEWLPDVGVSRAFANIDRPEARLGHEPRTLRSFEFTVRVPRAALKRSGLHRVQIALYHVSTAPERPITSEPLVAQLGEDVKEIARMPSLGLKALEPQVREELGRILQPPTTSG